MPLYIFAANLLLMTGDTLKELPLEGLHDLLVNANLELIKAMEAKDSIGIAAKTKHVQIIIDAIMSKKEIAKHLTVIPSGDTSTARRNKKE
jgi:hypothetical protein